MACFDFKQSRALKPKDANAAWMVINTTFEKISPSNDVIQRLEGIAAIDPQHELSYLCRGVALVLLHKWDEGLKEVEASLQRSSQPEDAYFWKGMICVYLGQDADAVEAIRKALERDFPPILLTPLYWLQHDKPQFFSEYAQPLLTQYNV